MVNKTISIIINNIFQLETSKDEQNQNKQFFFKFLLKKIQPVKFRG